MYLHRAYQIPGIRLSAATTDPLAAVKHQIYVQSHYVLVIGGNEARPQYLQ